MKTPAKIAQSKKQVLPVEKKQYIEPAWGLKRKILNQIINGQISKHHAHKKFNVSRSLIDYWLKKHNCSDELTELLKANKIDISVTQSYDPYENAAAERVKKN